MYNFSTRSARKVKIMEVFFAVRGTGQFPLDMLRYDNAVPATEIDAHQIPIDPHIHSFTTTHTIWLKRFALDGGQIEPTLGRWKSQGYIVIAASIQGTTPNDDDRKRIENMKYID